MEDQLEGDLEVSEEVEVEAEEQDPVDIEDEPETDETSEDEQQDESDDEQVDDGVLTIQLDGDDEEEVGEKDDTPVIRTMRQKLKDQAKKIKELEQSAPKPEPVALGAKPTLQDHEFDTDAYDAALLAWSDQKKAADAEAEKKAEAIKAADAKYQERRAGYDTRKAAMGVKDFDDAEDAVKDTLSPMQQSIIVAVSKDPALTVLALGRNAKHLDRLAGLEPVQFAYELAELESKMKVSSRKKPQPEKRVSGGSPSVPGANKKLEQARAEAEKTGDYTEVRQIKREMRSQK